MDKKMLSLGERILLATRLAVEEHMLQLVTSQMSSQGQTCFGGADAGEVRDDDLDLAQGHSVQIEAARLAEGRVA